MFEPYPLWKFKKLDQIKTLLSKSGDQDQGTIRSDFEDQDEDGVTMAKRPKIEASPEDRLQSLVSILELDPADKVLLGDQMKSNCSSLSLSGCLKIIRSLNNVSLQEDQISILSPIISNTFIRYKSDQNEIMEDLPELSSKQPKLAASIMTGLVPVSELTPAVLSLLGHGDWEEEQVVELFRLYLHSVPVNTNTIPSLEGFLSTRPELGRNTAVVSLLAENCYKNSTPDLNNCLRFAKFYRKIITSFPGSREQALQFLKPIIENNETFLKNRMERDLREKFPLAEQDEKTTTCRDEQE